MHHGFFCSVTLWSGDRPRKDGVQQWWCMLFSPAWSTLWHGVLVNMPNAIRNGRTTKFILWKFAMSCTCFLYRNNSPRVFWCNDFVSRLQEVRQEMQVRHIRKTIRPELFDVNQDVIKDGKWYENKLMKYNPRVPNWQIPEILFRKFEAASSPAQLEAQQKHKGWTCGGAT